jgi:sugar (pentulose or hexulose) kinase
MAIGLSVLCPGLVPLDGEGEPLRAAIIHLDRRSVKEAKEALEKIGKERFLKVAANLPYPGGMSVTSMLWIKNNEPDVFARTVKFGHTNTFLLKKLTGKWAIDPTNASFNGLFDTMDGLRWDFDITRELGFETETLPQVYESSQVVGKITPDASKLLSLPEGIPVIAGGGDTGVAAYGAGVVEEGDILNSTGTVEVMVLCTEHPIGSEHYLIRTHPLTGKWLIMNIIPTGGEAIYWIYRQLYRDMDADYFFKEHLPEVIRDNKTHVKLIPFFSGDRTSFRQRTASFSGITLGSTRDDMLKATCNAIVYEMKKRYIYYEQNWKPSGKMMCTGGGIHALLNLKKQMFPDVSWEEVKDATVLGAAKLAWKGIGETPDESKKLFGAEQ